MLTAVTDRFAAFEAESLHTPIDFPLFQRLALPIQLGRSRVPGIKIHDTRVLRLTEVLLHGGTQISGWRSQSSLWESKIRLGEDFFNEIINHPVPLNLNTLNALKRSPLGLDLYLWLVYRTFTLRAPLRLTWRLLYGQFGEAPGALERQGGTAWRGHG